MANMSYCRFHNTLMAFEDCLAELNEASSFRTMKLSLSEETASRQLAVLARKYLERYNELDEQAEYDFVRTQR